LLDNLKSLDSEALKVSIEKLLAQIPYDLIIEKKILSFTLLSMVYNVGV
jgi:hypothetical protein